MSEMQEYTLELPSGPVTVLLSDEDAERKGLTRAPKKAAPKAAEPEAVEAKPEEKAAKPANKSRTPRNKQA